MMGHEDGNADDGGMMLLTMFREDGEVALSIETSSAPFAGKSVPGKISAKTTLAAAQSASSKVRDSYR